MSNQEKPTAALISIDKIDAKFNEQRSSLIKRKEAIMAIKEIKDEKALLLVKTSLSEINDYVKEVDKVRETLKRPYFETGKLIDARAKEISEDPKEAIAHAKSLLLEWTEKQEKIRRAAEEKARKEREAAEKKSQEIAAKANEFTVEITNHLSETAALISNAKNGAELKSISDKYYAGFDPAKFCAVLHGQEIDLQKEATEVKKKILQIGKLKHALLKNPNDGPAFAQFKSAMNQIGIMLVETHSKSEEIQSKAEHVAEVEKAESSTDLIQARATSGAQVRHNWIFNVQKIEDVPYEMLILDDSKVREYIKAEKANLEALYKKHVVEEGKSGFIHNGIYFTKSKTVVA